MTKHIQDKPVYVAPEMLGREEDGTYVVIDERNNDEELDPTNIEHKIRIYERGVKEWFLKPATDLLSRDSSINSFLALMVCMSYIEGVEQYKKGKSGEGNSKNFFISSVKKLFPNKHFKDNDDLKELYSKTRCGLFHEGMVKGGVILNNTFEVPIEFEKEGDIVKKIKINPKRLLNTIKNDFEEFINELKDVNNRTSRENFNRMFSVI